MRMTIYTRVRVQSSTNNKASDRQSPSGRIRDEFNYYYFYYSSASRLEYILTVTQRMYVDDLQMYALQVPSEHRVNVLVFESFENSHEC